MPISKSIVLSAVFPSSKTGIYELEAALEHIEPYDLSTVEYYCESCNADRVGLLLGERKSVFLAAALQKERGLNPSSMEAGDRKKAVEALAECFRFGVQAGAEAVLINSGARPESDKRDPACLKCLKDSICELHHRVKDIEILLEPGDRDVEYRHLIGHTDTAVSFIGDVRQEVPCVGLVFDMSHIAQLNENIFSSWAVAKKYCRHVHLANCVLKKGSPLYGDKHPLFSVRDGVFSHEAASAFYRFIGGEKRPLTVGIEMHCPENSEQDFFKRLASETGWFFRRKEA